MQFGAKMWLTKNQRIPSLKLRGSVLFSLFNSLSHYTEGHFVILLMEKQHFFLFVFWWLGKTQRIFRVVEVLCMIPWWWIHVIKHLSKPRGYTTPRENPTVNCGLKVMVCQWRIIGCNTGTTWGRVFTMGESMGDVGRGCVRQLDTFFSLLLWTCSKRYELLLYVCRRYFDEILL